MRLVGGVALILLSGDRAVLAVASSVSSQSRWVSWQLGGNCSHDQVTETMMYDMLMGEEDASSNWDPEMNWWGHLCFFLINSSISRYGPMGIGYAPNKEQYTEHFLKPLRAAFSERDLQVFHERWSCALRVRVEMIQVDITWHDDIYRLIWSPAKDRTVGLWVGFMVVIQVVIIIMSWLLSQWWVTMVI